MTDYYKNNVRYNKKNNILIEIKEGEIFCPQCKGRGIVPNGRRSGPITMAKYLTCSKCLGDGKLDWVEQATGKSIFAKGNE